MKKLTWIVIISALAFPLIVNGTMFLPFSITPSGLGQEDWLSFWGSYGGGIATLLSIYITLKYYRKKDDEQRRLFKYTPFLERIKGLKEQVEKREIIKEELLTGIELSAEDKEDIHRYNELVASLKGYFSEMAVGTLIGVFQIEKIFENSEEAHLAGAIQYPQLPEYVKEYAEIITNLSLYENCTELLRSHPKLTYIISSEGGGSAGMWPYWWHTEYLKDEEEIKKNLDELFELVGKLTATFEKAHQDTSDKIFKDSKRSN